MWHLLQLLLSLFFRFFFSDCKWYILPEWSNIFLCILGFLFKRLSALNFHAFEYLAIHLFIIHFVNLYFPRIWVTKLYLHYNSCGFIYSINIITHLPCAKYIILDCWTFANLMLWLKKMSLFLAPPLMYLSRILWLKTPGAWHTRFQLCDLYSQDLLRVSGSCICACSFPFHSVRVQWVDSFHILYTCFIN